MLQKILVPLDGSSFAEFALPVATAVARRSRGSVEVLMAQNLAPAFQFGEWTESPEPWREEYLRAVEERIGPDLDGRVEHTLRIGRVPVELEKHVESVVPDLVVMATHGRGPLSRAWHGSVADHLVRYSPSPLLLVRPLEDEEPPRAEEIGFDRILIPLDGSELAEAVLEPALEMADLFGSDLVLVRVVHYPSEIATSYLPETIEIGEEVAEEGKRRAESYLDELAERIGSDEREIRTDVRVDVHPTPGILEAAREHEVNLVTLATHGRGGLGRALLGSVADKLIRSTHLPTLTYRPSEDGDDAR